MHVNFTEGQQHALCGLLDHKQQAICSDPEVGFFARTLAARYESMRVNIGGRPARKGVVSVTLTREDGRSLDALLEHEIRDHGNEHYAAALHALRQAREPKADPRRPNGRKSQVREALSL